MPGSTQHFVQFDHIRNGVVVLKNGDFRSILEVHAMNFGLKSIDEQEAIVFAFQNFLNSLDFDLQIVVQSRKMDITPYLKNLRARADQQENPLMQQQTVDYISFIESFVQETNIMAKRFYVVVPFSLVQGARKESGFFSAASTLLNRSRSSEVVHVSEERFKTAQTQLLQRVTFIRQSLEQVGLSSTPLDTDALLRLYWETYNPSRREQGEYLPPDAATFLLEDNDETTNV